VVVVGVIVIVTVEFGRGGGVQDLFLVLVDERALSYILGSILAKHATVLFSLYTFRCKNCLEGRHHLWLLDCCLVYR